MSEKLRNARWRLAALGAVMLMAGGCGGDDMTGPQSIEEAEFAASLGIDLADFTRTSSGLYIEDIAEGSGEPAASGNEVEVAYTGWLTNGTSFDGGAFSFVLGAGQVVRGFDEGVMGMRVGGVRRIIIPPALGYGSQGSGPVPPDSIMIFRIEVLAIG